MLRNLHLASLPLRVPLQHLALLPPAAGQAVERAVRGSMAAGSTDAVLPGMILNTGKVRAEGRHARCAGLLQAAAGFPVDMQPLLQLWASWAPST